MRYAPGAGAAESRCLLAQGNAGLPHLSAATATSCTWPSTLPQLPVRGNDTCLLCAVTAARASSALVAAATYVAIRVSLPLLEATAMRSSNELELAFAADVAGEGPSALSVRWNGRAWLCPARTESLHQVPRQGDAIAPDNTLGPRDPFFARMARDVLNYMRRDMTHPDGGIYSAEVHSTGLPSCQSVWKVLH